jgi:hypothetical protein
VRVGVHLVHHRVVAAHQTSGSRAHEVSAMDSNQYANRRTPRQTK